MAGVANEYFEIATRGAAKSFRAGIAAICAFSLYPYSEIVITSSTIPQAAKLVEKKIRDETFGCAHIGLLLRAADAGVHP